MVAARGGVLLVVVGVLGGCMERDVGAFDGTDPATYAAGRVPEAAPSVFGDRGSGTTAVELLPPVSGGTLLVTRDGRWAIASDADADVVRIVDLDALEAAGEVALEPGDEPGRLAEDADGRVHVALRGGGAVVSFRPEGGPASRRDVCGAPRGIAYDAALDAVHVACAGGELVTLPAAGGDAVRTVALDPDLRDVVVVGDELYVSRFRSAEVLVVGSDGALVERSGLGDVVVSRGSEEATFAPEVAWRMIPSAQGPLVTYQRVLSTHVDPSPGGYGGSGVGGSLDGCTRPIMHTGLARLSGSGVVRSRPMGHATLPVDVAVSPDGTEVALAFAGNMPSDAVITAPPVAVYDLASLEDLGASPCAEPSRRPGVPVGRALGVAYDPLGRLVIQVASPSQLVVVARGVYGGGVVTLGAREPYEAGHFLFHAATPSGLACASCHPEGGDDGFVWRFEGAGLRRTQPLWGGVLETAPFHWDGSVATMHDIIESTFSGRMGGGALAPADVAAIQHFVDGIEPPTARAAVDPDAVERGRALFSTEVAACAGCHTGPLGTDNLSHSVREANRMQTPALVGLLTRAPYMHDGCARDLREAVLACGRPELHGGAASLTPTELDDLVAYLQTR